MLMHIGEDNFLDSSKIVLVANLKALACTKAENSMRTILAKAKKISDNKTKSLIFTSDGTVYQSPIDSLTLRKRKDVFQFINKE